MALDGAEAVFGVGKSLPIKSRASEMAAVALNAKRTIKSGLDRRHNTVGMRATPSTREADVHDRSSLAAASSSPIATSTPSSTQSRLPARGG